MIKPIKRFDAYYFENEHKWLFGLAKDHIEPIEVIDQDGDLVKLNDFFIKADEIYFSVDEYFTKEIDGVMVEKVKTKFYKQKNYDDTDNKDGDKKRIFISKKSMTEIDGLPERPSKFRAHYESNSFSITETEYDGKLYSDIKNILSASGIERFLLLDGFHHNVGNGIYFNVPDGRYNENITVRENGLYHWGEKDKQCVYLVGKGNLWK